MTCKGCAFECEYAKEGYCDFPYDDGMTLDKIKEMTEKLKKAEKLRLKDD